MLRRRPAMEQSLQEDTDDGNDSDWMTDPELANRLVISAGSIKAGNTSRQLKILTKYIQWASTCCLTRALPSCNQTAETKNHMTSQFSSTLQLL